jgi:hypothetical protein
MLISHLERIVKMQLLTGCGPTENRLLISRRQPENSRWQSGIHVGSQTYLHESHFASHQH